MCGDGRVGVTERNLQLRTDQKSHHITDLSGVPLPQGLDFYEIRRQLGPRRYNRKCQTSA